MTNERSSRGGTHGIGVLLRAGLAGFLTVALVAPLSGVASAEVEERGDGAKQPTEPNSAEQAKVCEDLEQQAGSIPDDMPCLGGFWVKDEQGNRFSPDHRGTRFLADPELGRLALLTGWWDINKPTTSGGSVVMYDLNTATGIPTQMGTIDFPQGPADPRGVHLDPNTHRLVAGVAPEGCSWNDQNSNECYTDPPRVTALDLARPHLDPDGDGVPGMIYTLPDDIRDARPWAVKYDAAHDVLYFLTDSKRLQQTPLADPAHGSYTAVQLHAIDMAKLMPGPDVDPTDFEFRPEDAYLWTRRLDSCPELESRTRRQFLGITNDGGAAYLPCLQSAVQPPPAARHGVLHVDFNLDGADPRDLTQAEVDDFRLRWFTVAAEAFETVTAVDHTSDIFLLSFQGQRSRVWVFDGKRAGFTGFVPTTTDKPDVRIVQGTGRAYLEKNRIFDTRQIPLPQGRQRDIPGTVRAGDAKTGRLFVVPDGRVTDGQGNQLAAAVLVDQTGAFPKSEEPDPDAFTNDVDPEQAFSVSHAGGGSGYGARLRWIGGIRNADERNTTEGNQILCGPFCKQESDMLAEQTGLSPDDRDSFFGFVGRNTAQSGISGDRESGSAHANAQGVVLGEPWWEDYSRLDEQRRLAEEGEFQRSACADRGASDEDPTNEASAPGSAVTCEPQHGVTAGAWSSDLQDGLPGIDVKVGYARSDLTTERDPGKGMTSTVTSVARNISVGLPQAGALHIGEVRTVAKTWAGGRPGTAGSEFTVSINQVRIVGPDGQTQFACGWDTVPPSTGQPDDPDQRCTGRSLAEAVQRFIPTPVALQLPRPDTREHMTGSPGGAQAVLQRSPVAFWNNKFVMGDERWELPGLRFILYKDGTRESRFVLDLAAARSEAKYLIGQSATTPPPPSDDGPADLQPAGLEIELNDPDGQPLAGGEFAVHRDVLDDGLLDTGDPLVDTNAGTCTTGEDGVGDCTFPELEPGGYVITQTAAPDGYAPAPDFPVTLTDGFTSTVAFTNLRSVADIKITLTDTADPPNLLPGAVFVAVHGDAAGGADADGGLAPPDLSDLRDEGALQQHTFRCTTDEDGRCAMADVPLGHYTVRQTSAPDGYQPLGEDITFEFTEPGQVADLGLTNVTAADDGGTQLAGEGSATFDGGATTGTGQAGLSSGPSSTAPVRLDAGQAAPEPVVASQPNEQEQGLRRLVKLPAQGLGFLLRSPGEAAPFAAVWLLLGAPIYLLARRRSLNMTTTGQIS